jgi:hypothetical protein
VRLFLSPTESDDVSCGSNAPFCLSASHFRSTANNGHHQTNPSPNWPHEPVILLSVQWPDFGALPETKQLEVLQHRIFVTMSSLDEHPITSIAQITENQAKSGYKTTLDSAEYDPTELSSSLTKGHGLRDFIARPNSSLNFLIRCDLSEQQFGGNCEFDFPYDDVSVNAHFAWVHIKDWKKVYEKTVCLLDRLRSMIDQRCSAASAS